MLEASGRVYCWGENKLGQIGQDYRSALVTTPLEVPIASRVTGEHVSCALVETGNVLCWGSNSSGQIGDGTSYTALIPVPVRAPE